MASYGLHANNGTLSSSYGASYTIQSNLENLIANHVLSPNQESNRRFSGSSQHSSHDHHGGRPHMGARHPSVIPEEQPLMDDDEEEEDDRRNERSTTTRTDSNRNNDNNNNSRRPGHVTSDSVFSQSTRSTEDDRIPDIVVNAFAGYARRASVLSSIADNLHFGHGGHHERRESMLSQYSASDRARLAKLTTIVSGAETGEEVDEIHQAQHHGHHHHHGHRSNSMSPKLGRSSLRFTPLEPPSNAGTDERTPLRSTEPRALEEAVQTEDDDDASSSTGTDCAETHMLLDPATELDPIADLHLAAPTPSHPTPTWYSSAWAETKVLCASAAPIFGTQLLEYSLPLASVISIGHLSTTDLAASALANMTAAVTGYSILQGFISSLDLVMPTAWTSSEPQRVGYWLQRCAIIVLALMVPIVIVWLNAENILLRLGQDEAVAYRAGLYIRYLAVGLPGYALNQMMRKYFMAQNLQGVHQVISGIVAPLNLGLNYLLVWGPPAVRIGFVGAPLTTSISFNLSATLAVVWAMFFAPKTAWNGWGGFTGEQALFLLTQGSFGALQVASEWWAWEICGLMVASLGTVELAVNSVLLSFSSILFQFPLSGGNAAANRIGNLLGANRPVEASLASKVALALAVGVSMFNSAILVVLRHQIAYLFTSDPVVVAGVAQLTIYVALFQTADGIVGVGGGTMRVLGLVRKGAIINLMAYYIIGLPIGAFLCFKRDMGLRGLWIGLSVGITFAGIATAVLLLRVDWVATVTLVRKKLGLHNIKPGEGEEEAVVAKSYGTMGGGH